MLAQEKRSFFQKGAISLLALLGLALLIVSIPVTVRLVQQRQEIRKMAYVGGYCDVDGECDPGEICDIVNHRCIIAPSPTPPGCIALGGSCRISAECCSGYCDGTCFSPECAEGERSCAKDKGLKICVNRKWTYSNCQETEVCKNGQCVSSTPTPTPAQIVIGVCQEGGWHTECLEPRQRQSCSANAGVEQVFQCQAGKWVYKYPQCSVACAENVPTLPPGGDPECQNVSPGTIINTQFKKECDTNLGKMVWIEQYCDENRRFLTKPGRATDEPCPLAEFECLGKQGVVLRYCIRQECDQTLKKYVCIEEYCDETGQKKERVGTLTQSGCAGQPQVITGTPTPAYVGAPITPRITPTPIPPKPTPISPCEFSNKKSCDITCDVLCRYDSNTRCFTCPPEEERPTPTPTPSVDCYTRCLAEGNTSFECRASCGQIAPPSVLTPTPVPPLCPYGDFDECVNFECPNCVQCSDSSWKCALPLAPTYQVAIASPCLSGEVEVECPGGVKICQDPLSSSMTPCPELLPILPPPPSIKPPKTFSAQAYLTAKSETEKFNLIKDGYEKAGRPTLLGFDLKTWDEYMSNCTDPGILVISGICQTLNPRQWGMGIVVAQALQQEAKEGKINAQEAFDLAENDPWVLRELTLQGIEKVEQENATWVTGLMKGLTWTSSVVSLGHSTAAPSYFRGEYEVGLKKAEREKRGEEMSALEEVALRAGAATQLGFELAGTIPGTKVISAGMAKVPGLRLAVLAARRADSALAEGGARLLGALKQTGEDINMGLGLDLSDLGPEFQAPVSLPKTYSWWEKLKGVPAKIENEVADDFLRSGALELDEEQVKGALRARGYADDELGQGIEAVMAKFQTKQERIARELARLEAEKARHEAEEGVLRQTPEQAVREEKIINVLSEARDLPTRERVDFLIENAESLGLNRIRSLAREGQYAKAAAEVESLIQAHPEAFKLEVIKVKDGRVRGGLVNMVINSYRGENPGVIRTGQQLADLAVRLESQGYDPVVVQQIREWANYSNSTQRGLLLVDDLPDAQEFYEELTHEFNAWLTTICSQSITDCFAQDWRNLLPKSQLHRKLDRFMWGP